MIDGYIDNEAGLGYSRTNTVMDWGGGGGGGEGEGEKKEMGKGTATDIIISK